MLFKIFIIPINDLLTTKTGHVKSPKAITSFKRRKSLMSKIRPSGGYRSTASFQAATMIYDATYWFCEKFFNSYSRMVD